MELKQQSEFYINSQIKHEEQTKVRIHVEQNINSMHMVQRNTEHKY
jgi:hypothetical protein